ncbi:MAG: ABC transporter permease [Microbacteriaceae bacterium]
MSATEPATGSVVRAVPQAPSLAHRLRKMLLGRDAAIIALLVVVWIVATAQVPYFGTALTAYNLLLDIFPILLIALPMTLIVITGEIDLSVASMMGLSSVVLGALHQAGWPIVLAMLVALLVGGLGGALNGFLIAGVGLPSLAVTVGTLALFRGIAVGLLGTTAITDFPDGWKDIATERLFGQGTAIPGSILLFLVLAVVFIIVLHFTPVGRTIYSAGLNDEASRFSGIKTARLKLWLYLVAGLISALAGIYWTLRYNSARGDNAAGLELSVIAAVLVGGVSIFGGRGALPGVIAGVLLIGALRSALRLASVSDEVINVMVGVLLIVSVVIPSLLAWFRRIRERRGVRRAARSAAAT